MNELCCFNDKYQTIFDKIKKYSNMSNIAQRPEFKAKYDNYIGGKFVAPFNKEYFDVVSPIDGKVFT